MVSRNLAFLKHPVNALENNAHGIRTHRFHGLANRRERRSAESRAGNVIEADYRAVLRHAQAAVGKGANGAEGRHVVERQQGGERTLLPEQVLGEFLTRLEARKRIARFWQVDYEAGIDFEIACLGAVADAAPPRRAVA